MSCESCKGCVFSTGCSLGEPAECSVSPARIEDGDINPDSLNMAAFTTIREIGENEDLWIKSMRAIDDNMTGMRGGRKPSLPSLTASTIEYIQVTSNRDRVIDGFLLRNEPRNLTAYLGYMDGIDTVVSHILEADEKPEENGLMRQDPSGFSIINNYISTLEGKVRAVREKSDGNKDGELKLMSTLVGARAGKRLYSTFYELATRSRSMSPIPQNHAIRPGVH